MIRIMLSGILAYCIYRFFKSGFFSLLEPLDSMSLNMHSPYGKNTELIQDPQCGRYFMERLGVKALIRGQILCFCSATCRDAYREASESCCKGR